MTRDGTATMLDAPRPTRGATASLRRLLRLWCARRGHRDAFWMLPEEEFGLYAFSRYYCGRCETTFRWRPGFER